MATWYRFDVRGPESITAFEAEDGYVPMGLASECPVCRCSETSVHSISYDIRQFTCIEHMKQDDRGRWNWDYSTRRTHTLPDKFFTMNDQGELKYHDKK